MKDIDFTAFEEAFKLNPVPMNKARDSIDNAAKTPTVKVNDLHHFKVAGNILYCHAASDCIVRYASWLALVCSARYASLSQYYMQC